MPAGGVRVKVGNQKKFKKTGSKTDSDVKKIKKMIQDLKYGRLEEIQITNGRIVFRRL